MPDRPLARLHVEEGMIPMLRDLFFTSVQELNEKIRDLQAGGRIVDLWMNDPVSARFRDFYNEHVMDSPTGGFHCLVAYRDELRKVYEALGAMQRNYEQAETDSLALSRDLSGRVG